MIRRPPRSTLFPLHDALPIWNACGRAAQRNPRCGSCCHESCGAGSTGADQPGDEARTCRRAPRSEEHTSELQSQSNLVCRLLLEKKKHNITSYDIRLNITISY